ncbi:MAG: type II toxin-antitoxin system VapC family toxin [Candidatus Jordarchaeaceae archaeon]
MSSKRKPKTSGSPSSSERVLVDTSVLVEYSRTKRLELLGNSYLSTISLIEFLRYYKVEERRRRLKTLLEDIFQIVNIDNDIILTYCRLYKKLKEEGEPIEDADLLIASIAIAKDLILYTLNLKHFERLSKFGLKFLTKDS